uniref:Putative methyltransferase n=1 Tax=viral metagenome TaxID=1070528 RepID=A0A6M3JJ27_9ZZZZ
MSKPKVPVMAGHSDQFQTPPKAVDILTPYLNKNWIIWECAWGKGRLYDRLSEKGFNVIASIEGEDFLITNKHCDCIVTNPPYSIKDKFIARCYSLGKPFALLMPLTALEGQFRQSLYRQYGIKLLLPNKRFNFETPSGRGSGSWFATAWFTWGLDLPNELTFVVL